MSNEQEAARQSVDGGSASQPTMGEHCVKDRPTPSGEVPTGEITKLGDVDVYIARPSDYPHSPSKLLLLLTSGTGFKSRNNQIQADKYAAEGFIVVMPDQFGGDSAPNSVETNTPPESASTFIESIKIRVAEAAKSFQIDMWLARHTPETVLPILQRVINASKDEFADAVANGGGIYAVGYCFGAKYALMLGGTLSETTYDRKSDEEQVAVEQEPLVKASAIAHGTLITREDLQGIKVPVYLACVEQDPLFPEEILEAGRKALADNKVEHSIQVYPSVPHGFAIVGDYSDPKIEEAQKQAFGEMLAWLQSH